MPQDAVSPPSPPSPPTLAQHFRSRYPGAYDDLSDEQIETAALTKFPGRYDQFLRSSSQNDPEPTTPDRTTSTSLTPQRARRFEVDPKYRDAIAKMDAEVLAKNAYAKAEFERWVKAGPSRVKTGLYDVFGADKRIARGLYDIAVGTTITALPMVGGPIFKQLVKKPIESAFRTIAGLYGSEVAKEAALSSGLSEDQANLVSLAGGTLAAGPFATRISDASRVATQKTGEVIARHGLRDTADDVARDVATIGRTGTYVTRARQLLERGIGNRGGLKEMAAATQALRNEVTTELLAQAKGKGFVLPEKANIVHDLEVLAKQLTSKLNLSTQRGEAMRLVSQIKATTGQYINATDAIKARQFLDGLLDDPAFGVGARLAPQAEGVKNAADILRAAIHTNPQLSSLVTEQSTLINLDNTIQAAAGRPVGMIGSGGMSAAARGSLNKVTAAVSETARWPEAQVRLGQFLYDLGGGARRAAIPATGPATPTLLNTPRGAGPINAPNSR